MYRVLKDNGVTSARIIKGFRSPLSSIDESLLLLNRLSQELHPFRFYIRALALPIEELAKEAKEHDNDASEYPFRVAARYRTMGVVTDRLQRAWPGSVSAGDINGDVTAIIFASVSGFPDSVRTMATMGADLSHKTSVGCNVFVAALVCCGPPDKKQSCF
jgi:hypothetical protein